MTPRLRFALLSAVLIAAAGAWPAGQIGPVPAGQPGAQQPPATGTGFIAGQVVDATTGRPIAEATVMLLRLTAVGGAGRAGAGPSTVVSDPSGRYFFSGLTAGSYVVRADRTGYISPRTLPSGVDIGIGERVVDNRVRLVKTTSISGMVRDSAGDPVVGTEVLAFRRAVLNGRASLQTVVRGVKSDDRGAYRLPGLAPGDYFICACLRDPVPFDPLLLTTLASQPLNLMSVAARALTVGGDVVSIDDTLRMYAPTFHPNSPTVSRAARVTVAAGEEKSGVDVTAEFVRATRVSGQVVGAQSSVTAGSIRLVPALDAEAGVELTQIQPMLVQADGRFDFASVPPGQYRLIVTHRETGARGGGPTGIALGFTGGRAAAPPPPPVAIAGPGVTPPPVLWANQSIAVGDEGVRALVVPLNPTPAVSGRVQFVGSAPQPTEQMLNRAGTVVLQPLVISGPSFFSATGPLSPNLTFRVIGAVPGSYIPSFPQLPGYPTLKSVTLGGNDITDLAIEVAEKDLSELVLTFVGTPLASMAMSVPAPPGQRPDDEAILIFPADKKYWAEPAAARRRFRTAALTSKSTATASDLPAGDYLVVLVPGQEAFDWQESTRLDALSRAAQRVTLSDGEKRSIEVRR